MPSELPLLGVRVALVTGPGLDGPKVTVERAAEILHCGRSRVFELLASGALSRAPKVGRVTVLWTSEVLAFHGTPPPAPRARKPRPSRAAKRAERLAAVGIDGTIVAG